MYMYMSHECEIIWKAISQFDGWRLRHEIDIDNPDLKKQNYILQLSLLEYFLGRHFLSYFLGLGPLLKCYINNFVLLINSNYVGWITFMRITYRDTCTSFSVKCFNSSSKFFKAIVHLDKSIISKDPIDFKRSYRECSCQLKVSKGVL